MLPKRQRATKQLIENLFKNARRIKTSRFLVSFVALPGQKTPCISMVVSKKKAKSAVLRNRLRRKGYISVAPLVKNIKENMVILVSFDDGNPNFDNFQMTKELDIAFKKASIYKD